MDIKQETLMLSNKHQVELSGAQKLD